MTESGRPSTGQTVTLRATASGLLLQHTNGMTPDGMSCVGERIDWQESVTMQDFWRISIATKSGAKGKEVAMVEENSILSALAHIVSIIVPIAGLILAGGKWIISRIEKGQGELKEALATQGETHKKDFKKLRRELKSKVDRDECAQYREGCLCGLKQKGK